MYDILVFQFLIVICLDFQSYCTLTRFCIGQADRRATASAYESIIEIRSIFDIWSLILVIKIYFVLENLILNTGLFCQKYQTVKTLRTYVKKSFRCRTRLSV